MDRTNTTQTAPKTEEDRKRILRHRIMTAVKANGLLVTGDLFFALVFRTEQELKGICRELHLSVVI